MREENEDDLPIDRMLTVNSVMEMDGIKHTEVYRRIKAGEYEAYKDGQKKLLISLRSVLLRRKHHLRKTRLGTRDGLRGFPHKAEAVA